MSTNGQKLKGFRKQNKLSQADIAKVIGKSYRTVGYYESGRIMPVDVINTLNEKYNLKLKASKKVKVGNKVTVQPVTTATTSTYVEVNKFKGLLKKIVEPLVQVLEMLEK